MTRARGRREMAKTEKVAFFNAQDGVTGRDGGPYLDQVERVQAEQRRAAAEGRSVGDTSELLQEKLPAATGTDLRVAKLVPDNRLTSNPSMKDTAGLEQAITDETFSKNKKLADPISVLPVSTGVVDADDDDDEPTPAPVKATPAPTKRVNS